MPTLKSRWTNSKRREWDRRWRSKNKEYLREYQRLRYRTSAFYQRLYRQYGLTKEVYFDLLSLQNNSCAICKIPFEVTTELNATSKTRHIDHCHVTGKVRGILCIRCNTAIGKFKDDPTILRAAADYLERK